MSDFSTYVPASTRRRFGAFFLNLCMLSIPGLVFKSIGLDKAGFVDSFLAVAFILLCCLFPESPGKRVFSLRIVDEKMTPIGTRLRICRAIPIILFYAAPISGAWTESRVGMAIASAILMLTLFFIFANAVAVYFSPSDLSLLDMKLGTRVLAPRKVPGQENPPILGMRV